jgi:uncharacterized membrane protein
MPMWTRSELKARAKLVLKTTYWKAFLVSLLMAFVNGGISGGSANSGWRGNSGGSIDEFGDAAFEIFVALLVIILVVGFFVVLAALAFTIFLKHPLVVGVNQYFKQAAQQEANMNDVGFAFSKGRYWAIVRAMLLRLVFNLLWFLLFVIPGIVKAYAYSLVPYILADNPGIGAQRAIELSQRMTRGQKWKIFVLDLSFIGWFILGTIAFVVGVLFVFPYYYSTKAELYLALREQAIRDGICTREQLGLRDHDAYGPPPSIPL